MTSHDDSATVCGGARNFPANKTVARSKMADGSCGERSDPTRTNKITFDASDAQNTNNGDINMCSDGDLQEPGMQTQPETACSSQTVRGPRDAEDRGKRCFDRYDSSESSDRSVAFV